MHGYIFRDYREQNCKLKGDQRPNLTDEELAGFKSLQKRVKSGDIIILKTDKSNKFAVSDYESCLRMGEEHTKKDKEIERSELR